MSHFLFVAGALRERSSVESAELRSVSSILPFDQLDDLLKDRIAQRNALRALSEFNP